MKYLIIYEKAESNFSAYVPDLPGCIATGDTLDEAKRLIREAVNFHLEEMRKDGDEVPEPTTESEYLELTA